MKSTHHTNSDLKIRTKDYALSVIRLFSSVEQRRKSSRHSFEFSAQGINKNIRVQENVGPACEIR